MEEKTWETCLILQKQPFMQWNQNGTKQLNVVENDFQVNIFRSYCGTSVQRGRKRWKFLRLSFYNFLCSKINAYTIKKRFLKNLFIFRRSYTHRVRHFPKKKLFITHLQQQKAISVGSHFWHIIGWYLCFLKASNFPKKTLQLRLFLTGKVFITFRLFLRRKVNASS